MRTWTVSTPLYEAEFRLRPRLGDWKWILARGSVVERDKDGKPLRVAGTYIDITERKRAEEALRLSEERFRAIFDHAKDIIFIMDSDIKYRQVNPAMAKILNLTFPKSLDASPRMSMAKKWGDSFDCWTSVYPRRVHRKRTHCPHKGCLVDSEYGPQAAS